jgi:hypothetical protein
MIFKTSANIPKTLDTIQNLGFMNLIVSGCSFTHNGVIKGTYTHNDYQQVSWPYWLRDLGGFDLVLDTSMGGAGNYHISHSLQWAIEMEPPDVNKSLVIVMWSGNDRDDYICPTSNISDHYQVKFNYNSTVGTGLTGGSALESVGNTYNGLKQLALTKTHESRAIENYLYIRGMWSFLTAAGYKFIFLKWLDPSLPSRSLEFDIKKYLPVLLQKKLDSMILDITDPYTYALKNDLLRDDDLHPSSDGHLNWAKQVLFPKLQTIFS